MADDQRITHRLGIIELPEQIAVLRRMLEIAHGPASAQVLLATLEGYRFVVLSHPDPAGAGPFTTDSLEEVLRFFAERWQLSRRDNGDFHFVVNASTDVQARVDLLALEIMGSMPRVTGSGV